jgi:diguanylate cyclase (GGDEF)-like protein/PAS domain S-box-containing protein
MFCECPKSDAEWTLDPHTSGASDLFNGNSLAIWIYDADSLKFLDANDSAVSQYGYAREEFLQLTLTDLIVSVQETPTSQFDRHLYPNLNIQKHSRSNGSQIEVAIRSNDVVYRGRPCKLIIAEDLTERRTLDAELLQMANHDALTELPNRTLLADRMAQSLATAQRLKHKTAMISIDLDHFKKINDGYGHAIGDAYLKYVAQLLTGRLRGMDTVARMGGDEFTIILGEVDTVRSAGYVGKLLLKALNNPATIGGYSFQPSASLGIAVYPDHGSDMDEVWRCADAAMFRAKRAGGNRYLVAGPNACTLADDNAALDKHLHDVLKDKHPQLQYQPQYSLQQKLCGMEALLRLPDTGHGYSSPDRLVARAEDNGTIYPIGQCVVEEVCRQIQEWKALTGSTVRVAMNISPWQLMRQEFASDVAACLSRWNLDPSCLEMEIPEQSIVNADEIYKQMMELHELGIRLTVDEFGTGYSSLQHLHRLPIAALKIGRTLVQRILDSSGNYPMVNAIIAIGHSMKMEVIAAGVEREEQRHLLERLGCDSMQGYLFSKPAHPADLLKVIISTARDSQTVRRIDPYSMRRPVPNRDANPMRA